MRADRGGAVAGALITCAMMCALAGTAALCGCAASRAPHGWLPYAQEAQREGYGGWIEVVARATPRQPLLKGELLAVSDDSVWVLTRAGAGSCALADVLRATVEGYDPRNGDTARMTLAGTLTSFSTGYGLILVAPLWIVVGTISTAALSHDGRMKVDASRRAAAGNAGDASRRSWLDVRLYARFPQGMPAGLDRSQLRMRAQVQRTKRIKPMGRRDIVAK